MSLGPADLPGRVGRYEVLGRIGQGGMAEVFLARAVGPGGIAKSLCIKRMLPDVVLAPRAIERFTEEARTVLALQHANIVPVFDFGRDGQNLFLAMEWIDGCDLGALLATSRARGERLPPRVAAHIAVEVARALAYAHGRTGAGGRRAGILHSDVTPRNILLSREGEVRLTDFGIARALGAAGGRGGTPTYMAPENARGETVDERSDLYSLGLVFAEMLLGAPVRVCRDFQSATEPAALPDLPGIPEPFAAVVRRLLAPEPAARFSSAAEVVAALTPSLAAELAAGGKPPSEALAALVTAAAPPGAPPAGTEPLLLTAAAVTAPLPSQPSPSEGPAPATSTGRRVALAVAAVSVAVTLGLATRRRPPPPVAAARPVLPPAPVVAAREPPAAEPPPPSPPRPAPNAHLKIRTPGSWVAIYLDGRKLGEGPGLFEIPAGRHQLRVDNEPLGFSRTRTIHAVPGATVDLEFHTRR